MTSAITNEGSLRDAKTILREKGLLRELREIVDEIAPVSTDQEERQLRMRARGWDTEWGFSIGRNRPRFDAFKERVGVEYERGQQMKVRSHLLMMEAAYRQNLIDVGVFVIPTGRMASVRRTENELKDELFTYYFPIYAPVYLIEHD